MSRLPDLGDAGFVDSLGSNIFPEFIVSELEREDLPAEWRDELLCLAIEVQFIEDDLHRRMLAALRSHAPALQEVGNQTPLCSLIRVYASMVSLEKADDLLEFLRHDRSRLTLQAALQGIFSIFELDLPPDLSGIRALRRHVHALALERIDVQRVHGSEDAALAFCCFQAAAALADPDLADLQRRHLRDRAEELMLALARRGIT